MLDVYNVWRKQGRLRKHVGPFSITDGRRGRADTASRQADEPRSWFRLVEFMMIDVDGGGSIDFDEAAVMFRAQPTPQKNTPIPAVMVA